MVSENDYVVNLFNDNFSKYGSIIIDNKDFEDYMRGTIISMMFQNPNTYLNPLMKVGKQISEMLIYHKKYRKDEAKEKTISIMKEVGLDNKYYNYYPFELKHLFFP